MNNAEMTFLCRQIIKSYKLGETLSEKDTIFVTSVLEMHPYHREKVGVGIKRLYIAQALHKERCFWIQRVDGSKTDFSFLKCLRGENRRQMYLNATRRAIEPTIAEFKYQTLKTQKVCPISGLALTMATTEIDHFEPPFIVIAMEFSKGLDLSKIEYQKGDGIMGDLFKDAKLEKTWIAFHNSKASLRALHSTAHRKLPTIRWNP